MITEARITELVEECIADSDQFIVSVRVLPGNGIRVSVDRLSGMTVQDCVRISRHIEGSFDREVQDFSLEVGSPGLTESLVHPLQYRKNVGRELKVDTLDGLTVKGEVISATDTQVTILPKPKKKLKKNEEPPVQVVLPFSQIKQAKTVISFN